MITTTRSSSSSYRAEIDGLRALAVVAVIINHFNAQLLPSGYLGVDIFFVISGYVITSSLSKRPHEGIKQLVQSFYVRRIKRLTPALIACVLITSILICLFNPYPSLSLNTGATSLVGASNIYLWLKATDYFAESTQFNAFTHTWSLGVEEQFYLIFPLIIWGASWPARKGIGRKNLMFTLGTLSTFSLIGFVYLYNSQQAMAYFLMPTRFWEIGFGCLLFLWLSRGTENNPCKPSIPPLVITAGIVVVLFFPLEKAVIATILMVGLTLALIANLQPGTQAHHWFSRPAVVAIGLISYSLYLWHWSILVISRLTIGIHWWSAPFQAGLMLALASASYRWIESPLRVREWSKGEKRTIAYGLATILSFAASLLLLSRSQLNRLLFTGSWDAGEDRITRYLRKNVTQLSIDEMRRRDQCSSSTQLFSRDQLLKRYKQHCLFNAEKPGKLIALVGDSHAEANFPISATFAQEGLPTFFASRLGCVFPSQGEANPGCNSQMKVTTDFLLDQFRERGGGVVIVESYLQGHFGYEGFMRGQFREHPLGDRRSVDRNISDYALALAELAKQLSSVQGKVVVIGPKPDHEFYAARREPISARCAKQWFAPFSGLDCQGTAYGTSLNAIIKRSKPISTSLKKVASQHENLFFYDPLPWLCRDGKQCEVFLTDKPLYKDSNHLSKLGSLHLMEDLRRFLHTQKIIPASR